MLHFYFKSHGIVLTKDMLQNLDLIQQAELIKQKNDELKKRKHQIFSQANKTLSQLATPNFIHHKTSIKNTREQEPEDE